MNLIEDSKNLEREYAQILLAYIKKRIGDKMVYTKSKKLITGLFMLLFATVILSGCSAEESAAAEEDGRLNVVTTIGMIRDVVENIGGDLVEATELMGPGVDPHYYTPTQGDMRILENADLILYNGLHLEADMETALENLGEQQPVVAVTRDIPESDLLLAEEDDEEEFDPHVWFNVQHWITVTETIRDVLIEHDEENADVFKENAANYIAQLEELDSYIREQIATIPEESRVLVTAHDAFQYFGEAYGMEVKGLQGLNTAAEFSTTDVTTLRDYLIERDIRAVFIESSVPARGIEAVIEGAGELGHEVVIGGELLSDAMGEEGTEEGTYIGMIRHNVRIIVEALR